MINNKEALIELRASIEGCGFQCHIETYRAAIEALEKQVPKKPHVHPLYGQSFYNCPTCGAGKFAIMRGKKTRNDYCLKCGQALDWEDDHHAEG